MKITQVEYEDDEGNAFWWGLCSKKGCSRQICINLSDKHCYPCSKWYRPMVAFMRGIFTSYDKS